MGDVKSALSDHPKAKFSIRAVLDHFKFKRSTPDDKPSSTINTDDSAAAAASASASAAVAAADAAAAAAEDSAAAAADSDADAACRQENALRLNWISQDLVDVREASKKLREHEDLVNYQIEKAETKLKRLKDAFKAATQSSVEDAVRTKVIEDIHNLKNLVTKLKLQIPAKYKANSMDSNPSYGFTNGEQLNTKNVPNELLNLHKYPTFEHSFQVLYNGLKTELKLCLLCFSVFPEDVIIKKRLMIYWWIGEGFVSPTPVLCTDPSPGVKQTGEELGNDPTPGVKKTEELGNPTPRGEELGDDPTPGVKKREDELGNDPTPGVKKTEKELGNPTLREEELGNPTPREEELGNDPTPGVKKRENELGNDPTPGVKKTEKELGNPTPREEELGNETTSGVKKTTKELSNDPTLGVQKTAEELGNEYFNELMVKGFIEPVNQSMEANSCKMHPFVRSMVIMLAERAKFFDFDQEGNPTSKFSVSLRACLVGEGLANDQEFEKLHTLFNVNETILEFQTEWLERMKNVNVLYLGRWQTSAKHHIEIGDTKFLEGLKGMKHLKFLSLQGISQITKLSDSISKLANLKILDLRACHSLEVVPKRIKKLQSLTHLDMSECYLLNHMPTELSSLTELQVLKGFVIGTWTTKSCTLEDLGKLTKLRKLNIYTGMKNFPEESHLDAFMKLKALRKLKISWGAAASQGKLDPTNPEDKTDEEKQKANEAEPDTAAASQEKQAASEKPVLFAQLEKLDLQCFPHMKAPSWLTPSNLKNLKKLYIGGGKLSDLSQFHQGKNEETVAQQEKAKWTVMRLRLKYLSELAMDWKEMRELFPELIYLETMKCPNLAFFPCNESGIWINKMKI